MMRYRKHCRVKSEKAAAGGAAALAIDFHFAAEKSMHTEYPVSIPRYISSIQIV
jgi:hypothetical protein